MESLTRLISNGRIDEFFLRVKELFVHDEKIKSKIALLEGRFSNYNESKAKDIKSDRELSVEYNKLMNSLIELSNEVEIEDSYLYRFTNELLNEINYLRSDLEKIKKKIDKIAVENRNSRFDEIWAGNNIPLPLLKFFEGGRALVKLSKLDTISNEFISTFEEVFISDIYLSEEKVTNEEFFTFLLKNPIETKKIVNKNLQVSKSLSDKHPFRLVENRLYLDTSKGDLPVEVTYGGALMYCNWLKEKFRANFTLPSEKEWAYVMQRHVLYQGNFDYLAIQELDVELSNDSYVELVAQNDLGKGIIKASKSSEKESISEWCEDALSLSIQHRTTMTRYIARGGDDIDDVELLNGNSLRNFRVALRV